MMTPEERGLIEGLFQRLNEAAKSLPANQIDPEADRSIRAGVSAQPIAPYLLVQNALVMENAMTAAQARIAELEADLAAAKAAAAPAPAQAAQRGFLSGGGLWSRAGVPGAAAVSQPTPAYPQQGNSPQGYPQQGPMQQGFGRPQPGFGQAAGQPSFLRSALTTAAGVAGGALLFQGISSLLSSHGGGTELASAAQTAGAAATPSLVNDTAGDPAAATQSAAYEPPSSGDYGYTPASYEAPEPDFGSDFGYDDV
jgi:hypothetical protein